MAAFLFGTAAMGQTVALKTNLLYDATATVNAGLELGMAPQWTIDLNGNYNGWSTGGIKKWEHILVNPEVRYWLCERFAGHFFGQFQQFIRYRCIVFQRSYNRPDSV